MTHLDACAQAIGYAMMIISGVYVTGKLSGIVTYTFVKIIKYNKAIISKSIKD